MVREPSKLKSLVKDVMVQGTLNVYRATVLVMKMISIPVDAVIVLGMVHTKDTLDVADVPVPGKMNGLLNVNIKY